MNWLSFFFPKRNIILRQVEVVYLMWIFLCSSLVLLMGSRNHPPQPVLISSSIFFPPSWARKDCQLLDRKMSSAQVDLIFCDTRVKKKGLDAVVQRSWPDDTDINLSKLPSIFSCRNTYTIFGKLLVCVSCFREFHSIHLLFQGFDFAWPPNSLLKFFRAAHHRRGGIWSSSGDLGRKVPHR